MRACPFHLPTMKPINSNETSERIHMHISDSSIRYHDLILISPYYPNPMTNIPSQTACAKTRAPSIRIQPSLPVREGFKNQTPTFPLDQSPFGYLAAFIKDKSYELEISQAPLRSPQTPQKATSPALIYSPSLHISALHFQEPVTCSGRRTLAHTVQVSERGGFSREQIGQVDGVEGAADVEAFGLDCLAVDVDGTGGEGSNSFLIIDVVFRSVFIFLVTVDLNRLS
ncbi:hypothetical protein EYC84_002674 [Monilinia fructicola]|uniref:Uncharacterized protein n=1 Tax=Monilinia fructicola TaxID=38448 RepID=A0A5M9JRG8_MONFR|nr:hypothetical protein EYC84_002674 [Monilinia fructicola]